MRPLNVAVACSVFVVFSGCSNDEKAVGDARSADDGGRVDGQTPDGAAGDLETSALEAVIGPIVAPHVDPATALTDPQKTVGLVVAAMGPQGRGVLGYGLTAVQGGRVPDGDAIFQIGSVSKYLTGLALARTVGEDAELALDDPVETHLPGVAGSNGTRGVTLRHLVTHYAGLEELPDNFTDRDGDGQIDPGIDPFSPGTGYDLALLGAYLRSIPEPVTPGQAYRYSNVGSGLLGLALQRHLGAGDYHALLRQVLLDPLQIDDLWGEVAALPATASARVVQGYARQGNQRVPGKPSQMGVLASAGEALTSGRAMLRLLDALTGRQQGRLEAAIVTSLQPLAMAEQGDSIGHAIEIEGMTSGGPIYKKGGNTVGGYSAYLAFRRDPRVGVVVLTNVARFVAVRTIALTIVEALSAGS